MSSQLNLRKPLACVLMFSLVVTGLLTLTTRQSNASNDSPPRSLTPSVKESSEKTAPQTKTADETKRARASEAYSKRPLSFEENRGQAGRHVKYVARGAGYALFLAETEAVLALRRSDGKKATTTAADARSSTERPHPYRARSGIVRMRLSGASRTPAVTGESKMGVRRNYPRGNDSKKRQTDVAHYERVRYAQVYPGVDVIYYGQQQQLKYDFEVAPGADAGRIALEFGGVKRVKVERRTGELVLEIEGGEVRQRRPVAYQEVGGKRREVASRYVSKGKKRVGIEVKEYDRTKPLVINSVLSYSTYLSGNRQDSGTTISSDSRTPNQSRIDQPIRKPAGSEYYSIGGYVTDSYGYGIEGVFMSLDGTDFNYTYTDYDGYYSFDGLQAGGDYTVTPYSDFYTFDPEYQSFYYLQSDEGADFTALSGSFSISGYVTDGVGVGIEGVFVSLDGTDFNYTYTDYDGYYSFDGLQAGGDYTVYPYWEDFTFYPSEQSFFDLQENQTDVNFETHLATISGWVGTADGAGLAGVTLTLIQGWNYEPISTSTTASDGTYSFIDVPAGPHHSYLIQPTLVGYKFSPPDIFISGLYYDMPDVNFYAVLKTYSIIGVVKAGETRLPGVTVKLTSQSPAGFPPLTTTTNSGGAYSFGKLPPGRNYIVTPTKSGYQITPASKTINDLSANQTRVDFDATVYSIRGRIRRTNINTGIGGVTVALTCPTLRDFADRAVRTDSQGYYTFTNLPARQSYTIKPARGGFTFTPATRSVRILSGNIPAGTSTNFTGAGP